MNVIQRGISDSYSAIMDPSVSPLRNLPSSQRFQAMMALSMMWTLIFCAGTGAWLWYGELVVFHVLVALGAIVTGITFRRANNERT